MKISRSPHFLRAYHKAPKEIQKAFDKQVALLAENLRHPSLHAKKYDEGRNLWQARVTGAWRHVSAVDKGASEVVQAALNAFPRFPPPPPR